jgi:hypothetical protein
MCFDVSQKTRVRGSGFLYELFCLALWGIDIQKRVAFAFWGCWQTKTTHLTNDISGGMGGYRSGFDVSVRYLWEVLGWLQSCATDYRLHAGYSTD